MCEKLDGVRKRVYVMCLDDERRWEFCNVTPRNALTMAALGKDHVHDAQFHSVGYSAKLCGNNNRTASIEHNDKTYSCTNLDKGE